MAGLQWRRLKIVVGLIIGCCLLAPPVSALELGSVDVALHSTTEYRLQWSDKPADYMLNDQDNVLRPATMVEIPDGGSTKSHFLSIAATSLLRLVDGSRSGQAIVDTATEELGVPTGKSPAASKQLVVGILQELHAEDALVVEETLRLGIKRGELTARIQQIDVGFTIPVKITKAGICVWKFHRSWY